MPQHCVQSQANYQNKLNCAAAIIRGETKSFEHSFKDYEAACWRHYECWQEQLKAYRGFHPPVDPVNALEADTNENGNNENGADNVFGISDGNPEEENGDAAAAGTAPDSDENGNTGNTNTNANANPDSRQKTSTPTHRIRNRNCSINRRPLISCVPRPKLSMVS